MREEGRLYRCEYGSAYLLARSHRPGRRRRRRGCASSGSSACQCLHTSSVNTWSSEERRSAGRLERTYRSRKGVRESGCHCPPTGSLFRPSSQGPWGLVALSLLVNDVLGGERLLGMDDRLGQQRFSEHLHLVEGALLAVGLVLSVGSLDLLQTRRLLLLALAGTSELVLTCHVLVL